MEHLVAKPINNMRVGLIILFWFITTGLTETGYAATQDWGPQHGTAAFSSSSSTIQQGAAPTITIPAAGGLRGAGSHNGNIFPPSHHSGAQHTPHYRSISNETISGINVGCKHSTTYDTTPNVRFQMCTGQTDQDLKNGMSIINLVNSRGFLPTCRIMQLMLWMASTAQPDGRMARETFADIGANIGSCTVHMASLGFHVISAEPVNEHISTIKGSMHLNPAFQIDLHQAGVADKEGTIKANFGHGARNWGATEFHEVGQNDTFEMELQLKPLDHLLGTRRVSLLKVDCEGCEAAAIFSAKRAFAHRRVGMIKIELVQPSYQSGNDTISAQDILVFLQDRGHFDLFVDHWNEQNLYFGKRGSEVMDIDKMFGSKKFNLPSDPHVLRDAARLILSNPINATTFHQKNFMKQSTDVIAIERNLADKMRAKFLSGGVGE